MLRDSRIATKAGKVPTEKLYSDCYTLEFKPHDRYNFWTYCTVEMSLDRENNNLIELFIFSSRQDETNVALLTFCASYLGNDLPLNLNYTVNVGQPGLNQSECDHGFISLPYLDGENPELFNFNSKTHHCTGLSHYGTRKNSLKPTMVQKHWSSFLKRNNSIIWIRKDRVWWHRNLPRQGLSRYPAG